MPGQAKARRAFNYPYEAVEEILTNAVYHRSYQVAEPITVRVTPDEMEVTSFPGFDRSISEDAIAGRVIRARGYRNRRIGDYLKELGMTEGEEHRVSHRVRGHGGQRFRPDRFRDGRAAGMPLGAHSRASELRAQGCVFGARSRL